MQFKDSAFKKAVTFSYDDGVTQDIRLIELLNKYHLKCTFNLNSEKLGQNRILMCKGQRVSHYKVHPADVREIYEGHEIAVHTLTHPRLTELEEAEIIRQVEQDRLNLSELAGYEVIGMAYPCGGVNNDDRVAEIIGRRTPVRYARTITSTFNFEPQENLLRFNPSVHTMQPELFDLAEKFIALQPETPQLFYIWGHSYEFDIPGGWERMEKLCEMLAGRGDIAYLTNREALL